MIIALPVISGEDATPVANLRLGEPFFIECTVDGVPTPSVVWLKNGAELNVADDNIQIVTINARKSSRVEVSMATSDFIGNYTCVARNVAGSNSTSFIITNLQGWLIHYNYGITSITSG